MKLYSDLCKNWIFKAIKIPLISLYQDENLSFNFIDVEISMNEKENRLMKLKVRLKGMIQGILSNTIDSQIPETFFKYMASVIQND